VVIEKLALSFSSPLFLLLLFFFFLLTPPKHVSSANLVQGDSACASSPLLTPPFPRTSTIKSGEPSSFSDAALKSVIFRGSPPPLPSSPSFPFFKKVHGNSHVSVPGSPNTTTERLLSLSFFFPPPGERLISTIDDHSSLEMWRPSRSHSFILFLPPSFPSLFFPSFFFPSPGVCEPQEKSQWHRCRWKTVAAHPPCSTSGPPPLPFFLSFFPLFSSFSLDFDY